MRRAAPSRQRGGFTLIELMLVVSIIATLAAVSLPKLFAARVTSNETAAISALRSIASAQASVQSSNGIDTDRDGWGEYGYFAELSGAQPCRISVAGLPAPGVVGVDELAPSVLSPSFGNVTANRQIVRSGYILQMWLPGAPGGGVTPGVAEDPAPGGKAAAPFPDPASGSVLWACYAWPLVAGRTGNRAFFINEQGDLVQTLNRGAGNYSGAAAAPTFDAVYSFAGDMASPLGLNGLPANDLNIWTVVQ